MLGEGGLSHKKGTTDGRGKKRRRKFKKENRAVGVGKGGFDPTSKPGE